MAVQQTAALCQPATCHAHASCQQPSRLVAGLGRPAGQHEPDICTAAPGSQPVRHPRQARAQRRRRRQLCGWCSASRPPPRHRQRALTLCVPRSRHLCAPAPCCVLLLARALTWAEHVRAADGYVPALALSIVAVIWFSGALVASAALLVSQGSRWLRVLRCVCAHACPVRRAPQAETACVRDRRKCGGRLCAAPHLLASGTMQWPAYPRLLRASHHARVQVGHLPWPHGAGAAVRDPGLRHAHPVQQGRPVPVRCGWLQRRRAPHAYAPLTRPPPCRINFFVVNYFLARPRWHCPPQPRCRPRKQCKEC